MLLRAIWVASWHSSLLFSWLLLSFRTPQFGLGMLVNAQLLVSTRVWTYASLAAVKLRSRDLNALKCSEYKSNLQKLFQWPDTTFVKYNVRTCTSIWCIVFDSVSFQVSDKPSLRAVKDIKRSRDKKTTSNPFSDFCNHSKGWFYKV